jgi:hypothetical protein
MDGVLSNSGRPPGNGKSGYQFAAVGAATAPVVVNNVYGAGAAPVSYNQTGVRLFCSTEDGVIHADPNVGQVIIPVTVRCDLPSIHRLELSSLAKITMLCR